MNRAGASSIPDSRVAAASVRRVRAHDVFTCTIQWQGCVMFEFLFNLFDTTGFPARWSCGSGWTAVHGWTHIIADLLTWGAYTAIPIVLLYFVRKRRDVPFPKLFWLFGAFIFACGTVHLIEAIIFWVPIYRVSALIKVMTAVVSWGTVAALIPVMPRALALPRLEKINEDLARENAERRSAESALRESEARLRLALEGGHMGTWDWSLRDDALTWSASLETMHALEPGSFGGRFEEFKRLVHPDDVARVLAEIRRAVAEHDEYHLEHRACLPDGRQVWMEARGRFIFDLKNRPERMVGVCADVTERKRAEQRFRLAVEASPNGMIMVDRTGRIILANTETEKMFGYPRDELMGQPIEVLVPERLRGHHPLHRQEFMKKPQTLLLGAGRDLYGRRKDGTEFPVEIGLNPIETDQGMVVLSAIADITDRKQAEEAIARANEQLKQKNEEMEQFVYTVSHDLKSPLVTIRGFLGFLAEDLAAGNHDQVQDGLRRIKGAAEHMSELIGQLLDSSRIGRIDLRPEWIDVDEMLARIVSNLRDRLEQAGASMVVQPHLPPLHADRIRLTEVFDNLITNAIKYGCGGEDRRIEIGAVAHGNKLRYYVRDHGAGIDPAHHARVFGFFQRLGTAGEGTGVGLTIVARIMQIHGGRTWVESVPRHGATFWLEFPAQAGELTPVLAGQEINV